MLTLALLLALWPQDDLQQGRAHFVRLGCVHCHAEATPGALTRESPRGPDLRHAGRRLAPAWVARWLLDPQAERADATMPRLCAEPEAVADLAAYLANLGGKFDPRPNRWVDRDGERLFVVRGCIACHPALDEPEDTRTSLAHVGRKTSAAELAGYLERPLTISANGLMPDLELTRGDAEAIAGYLVGAGKPLAPVPTGDRDRGRQLFGARGCGNCHEVPDGPAPARAPALAAIAGKSGGCLAPTPAAGLPVYRLTPAERAQLTRFVHDPDTAEPREQATRRRTRHLGCTRCHEFEGGGGLAETVREQVHARLQSDHQESGLPPDLREIGARLRRTWVTKVLEGNARARPFIDMRMPRYAAPLVAGLAEQICGTQPAEPAAKVEHAKAEAGRTLLGNRGFSCITCHDFGGRPAVGTRGPDLARMHERLLPEYVARWLRDPSAVRPGTRMPTFFRDVVAGEAKAQIEALQAALALGPRLMPPEGLAPPPDTVVVPTDRPIVLRTELPDTAVRSLAIGFPDGLSLAFETMAPRLAYVWQGGFLDMRRKWTGRGDGPADLVGGRIHTGAKEPMFWRDGKPLAVRFTGHDLGKDRVTLRFVADAEPLAVTFSCVRTDQGPGLRLDVRSERPLDKPESTTIR